MTTLSPPTALSNAAVLVPVYRDDGGVLRMVLVVRGPHGIHGGQIALPGGLWEPGDPDLLSTALREAEEEVGLRREDVEILAPLPRVRVNVSRRHVWPFLGRLGGRPPAWRRQEQEIAEVLDVAVDDLLEADTHQVETWQLPGWTAPRRIPFYRIGPHKLWGATYRIVHPLLPRLVAGEWPV